MNNRQFWVAAIAFSGFAILLYFIQYGSFGGPVPQPEDYQHPTRSDEVIQSSDDSESKDYGMFPTTSSPEVKQKDELMEDISGEPAAAQGGSVDLQQVLPYHAMSEAKEEQLVFSEINNRCRETVSELAKTFRLLSIGSGDLKAPLCRRFKRGLDDLESYQCSATAYDFRGVDCS